MGRASQCAMYHPTRDIRLVAHGHDFAAHGTATRQTDGTTKSRTDGNWHAPSVIDKAAQPVWILCRTNTVRRNARRTGRPDPGRTATPTPCVCNVGALLGNLK